MRVAFTIEQCWHRVPGGTAIAALNMGKQLAARSDVELVGVAAAHLRAPPAGWAPSFEVRHLMLPRPLLYEAWHRLRIGKVERATGTVDVIHATALTIPPRSAPLVVTIHDLLFLKDPANFTSHGVRFFERALRVALAEADVVTCPSTATMQDCLGAGFDRDRLRLVPMGVEVRPATQPEIEHTRRRYGLQRPYVLWVGTVEPRKNLANLLAAFDRTEADVDLVLAGPKGWNEDLPDRVRDRERIKMLGFVPHEDLAPLYAGAAIFCFPSLDEGFGLPVLEAMGQGTPVVTSKGTSTEEVAGEAARLVDPRDPGAIADALTELLDDPDRLTSYRSAGKERAAEYPWSRTAVALYDIYTEVSE